MNLPPKDAIRVPAARLSDLSREFLVRAGVSRQDADLITELLIDTDGRGVLSHGTQTLGGYIRAFLDGRLNPRPRIRVVRDEPVTAIVDGDGGLGHLAARLAADLAIDKAKDMGMGAVVCRNHGHFGGAGKYTRMVVRQDCIGFCVSGHTMEGFGGEEPRWNPFGNPPMSFAFPSGEETPLILDMGTSFFEPEHFSSLFEKAPAAFFKSVGLVGVANFLGGVMAGMMQPEFRSASRRYAAASYGSFVWVLDVGRFVSVEEFKAEVDRTMREVHELPPLPGFERYDLPGGPERERERAWAAEGIPLGPTHRSRLEEVADELGVPVPWPRQG